MSGEYAKDYVVWKTRDEHRDDDEMTFHSTVVLSRYDKPALTADIEQYQDAAIWLHNRRCVVLPFGIPESVSYRFAAPASKRPTHRLTVGTVVEGIARWAVRAAIRKLDKG